MLKYILIAFLAGIAIGIVGAEQYNKPLVLTKNVVKDRIVTVTKTVTKPDGTTTTLQKQTQKITATAIKSEAKPKLDYGISFSYDTNKNIAIGAQRRMLGNLWLTGQISQSNTVSVGVLYEF
jgi:hypothetical protein